MAVSLELHNTCDSGAGAEVRALVEHALSDRPGDWRVSIVGSRENDSWEMKILGPNGFERSYTLVGSAGEHQPLVIGNVLRRLLPGGWRGDRDPHYLVCQSRTDPTKYKAALLRGEGGLSARCLGQTPIAGGSNPLVGSGKGRVRGI
jgi:hypothetical protein